MNEILDMSIHEMAKATFACSCGRTHSLDIDQIVMGQGAIKDLPKILSDFKDQSLYLLSDNHTYEAAGKEVERILEGAGYRTKQTVLDSGDGILIPDEKAVGKMFMELEENTGMIVAIGSGTLNDMAKYMSSRTRIPYTIVCTAPSMDGYASDGAPLMNGGKKISYKAVLPYAIVGDTDIMKKAPMRMIYAGYGDVIGKLTALADWKLSQEKTGEYYCDTIVKLVEKAVDKVVSHTEELANREEEAVLYLIEALTLTGVAMGLIGVSRPASGAEHMLSHYLEMAFIAQGKYPELHGIKVGIAAPIIAAVFDEMQDVLPESVKKMAPSGVYIENLLTKVGAPIDPKEIGIDRDLFYHCLLEGNTVRERYSVLDLAVEEGKIEEIAEKITSRFYE
ncbi:MAG TPA: sn-glycerol-1-phosphate dehydrogenase [Candidatus Anaerostipes excrementavium]|uniref:Sn-glycerol-1-phosphate dehydrogenase n=1 Tax=Candidatus Anaerostipes excrementavium TaxID=2838463 RepID=A0A9D2B898_9FIRM|nr:sn-glycerol-1-phosphate dehydrogenase [uncultured Anaerostipes sp.]HIX66955.1 sn-glycerol-1-phosphate dehydrogenase [Candidatus Anaerostipes excrementavium]